MLDTGTCSAPQPYTCAEAIQSAKTISTRIKQGTDEVTIHWFRALAEQLAAFDLGDIVVDAVQG